MGVLTKSKRNVKIQNDDLNTVLSNIDKCDHHDLVRVDNLITQINMIPMESTGGEVSNKILNGRNKHQEVTIT